MAIYTISNEGKGTIYFGAIGVEAKIESVRFLLRSLVDTFPMDRSFGMNPPVDDPSEMAQNEWAAQIITGIERNVMGAYVDEVTFSQAELGRRIIVVVKVGIEDGEI